MKKRQRYYSPKLKISGLNTPEFIAVMWKQFLLSFDDNRFRTNKFKDTDAWR